MEFYLTPNATAYFTEPIRDAIDIVKGKMVNGFFPWLMTPFKKKYPIEAQFDLPIFFVCENDLGKSMWIPEWHICKPEKYEHAIDYTGPGKSIALNLPEYVEIPNPHSFDYEQNGRLIDPKILRSLNAEDSLVLDVKTRVGSFDWLGLYYGFEGPLKGIFIRIEKIMRKEEDIANDYGVAVIVLHELAHALMDTRNSSELKFTAPVNRDLADSLSYYMEEAMANLVAYRSIRGREVSNDTVRRIARFMSGQPFPYSLGLRMGQATVTRHSSLDFLIKSYVLKWYDAKDGKTGIGDCRKWYELIYEEKPFTDSDLEEQCEILFS